ncbi:hypothetical protein ACX80W_08870 [Arthrobacter sp. TMN-37]
MQHQRTYDALECSGLSLGEVVQHYLNMGGSLDGFEVDAYLHGLIQLPFQERDCISQAVNELIDDMFTGGSFHCCRAPYSAEHHSASRRRHFPRFRLAN